MAIRYCDPGVHYRDDRYTYSSHLRINHIEINYPFEAVPGNLLAENGDKL